MKIDQQLINFLASSNTNNWSKCFNNDIFYEDPNITCIIGEDRGAFNFSIIIDYPNNRIS